MLDTLNKSISKVVAVEQYIYYKINYEEQPIFY